MVILINKRKALNAVIQSKKDNAYEAELWKHLGLEHIYVFSANPDASKLAFRVIDKDLLLFSMFKYDFEIELRK